MKSSETTFIVWLCPKGLAALYPFKVNSQDKLRADRKLPHSKIGGYILYDRARVDKWIIEHEVA